MAEYGIDSQTILIIEINFGMKLSSSSFGKERWGERVSGRRERGRDEKVREREKKEREGGEKGMAKVGTKASSQSGRGSAKGRAREVAKAEEGGNPACSFLGIQQQPFSKAVPQRQTPHFSWRGVVISSVGNCSLMTVTRGPY